MTQFGESGCDISHNFKKNFEFGEFFHQNYITPALL
jgi:hypothetical protein